MATEESRQVVALPDLELFDNSLTQTSVKAVRWARFRVENPIANDGSAISINVPGGVHYIDPKSQFLQTRMRIVYHDGEVPNMRDAADPCPVVAPINGIGWTFIKDLKLYMGGGKLIESHPLYSFRCDLENVLNYSETGASMLAPGFYFPWDQRSKLEVAEAGVASDSSFARRANYFMNGEPMTVVATVRSDLLNQGKLLPNYTNIRLEILPNNSDFCIFCPDDGEREAVDAVDEVPFSAVNPYRDYVAAVPAKDARDGKRFRLELIDVEWHVKLVELADDVRLALESTIPRHPYVYNIRRVQVRNLNIAPNTRTAPPNIIFTGRMPRTVAFCLCPTNSFYGTQQTNPLWYTSLNLTKASVLAGGSTFPALGFNTEFLGGAGQPDGHAREGGGGNFTAALMQTLCAIGGGLGGGGGNGGTQLHPSGFECGHTIFAVNLGPSSSDSSYMDARNSGPVSIELEFSANVPEPGYQVVCGTADSFQVFASTTFFSYWCTLSLTRRFPLLKTDR
ncbi:MAG: hypothetical protein GY696_34820 [Gammaproteobacteria bacterium]|nr:hypothetical protein [Gammaproteobacteria bacterium]